MGRLFKNSFFYFILVLILIISMISISAKPNSKLDGIRNIISIPFSPVQKFISFTSEKIQNFTSYFTDIDDLKSQNALLQKKLDELESENYKLEGLKEKNVELTEALNIRKALDTNEQLIGANIIAKDLGNWFDVFTIDAGSSQSIAYNDSVITSKGLVGRVINSQQFTSKVISILDPESVVYARLQKSRDLVKIKGDAVLKDNGYCKLENIPSDVDVSVGDVIETSGLSSIYPKGIIIGKVFEVRRTSNELNKYAIVKPLVDFKRLEDVYVLKSNGEKIGSEDK